MRVMIPNKVAHFFMAHGVKSLLLQTTNRSSYDIYFII